MIFFSKDSSNNVGLMIAGHVIVLVKRYLEHFSYFHILDGSQGHSGRLFLLDRDECHKLNLSTMFSGLIRLPFLAGAGYSGGRDEVPRGFPHC